MPHILIHTIPSHSAPTEKKKSNMIMPYLKYCISTAETLVSEILVQDITINFLISTGMWYLLFDPLRKNEKSTNYSSRHW